MDTKGGDDFEAAKADYMQGGCHHLAIAVQEAVGGSLLVLATAMDRDELVHVGVLVGGRVIDAEGATDPDKWFEPTSSKGPASNDPTPLAPERGAAAR